MPVWSHEPGIMWKELEPDDLVWSPALSLVSYATLGNKPNLSELQFPHLRKKKKKRLIIWTMQAYCGIR